MSRHTNNNGFGLIGVLLVIIVLAAAGGVGTYVYHKNHKAKVTTASSSTQTGSNNSSTGKNGGATQNVDPYAEWKTYTDATNHYSFRYPADWTLTNQGTSASVRAADNGVLVSYANPFVKDSGVTDFYAADVENVVADNTLKIIGGAVTANYLPSYSVVDASLLKTYPLTVGQTGQFVIAPRFTDEGASNTGQLMAYPVGSVFTTNAQVQAWFATPDAKTSLLILKSLTYQQ